MTAAQLAPSAIYVRILIDAGASTTLDDDAGRTAHALAWERPTSDAARDEILRLLLH